LNLEYRIKANWEQEGKFQAEGRQKPTRVQIYLVSWPAFLVAYISVQKVDFFFLSLLLIYLLIYLFQ